MKSKNEYYVYIPGILGIRTNIKKFRWSYGTDAPICSETEFDKCKVKVFLNLVKDKDVFSEIDMFSIKKKFHNFSFCGENKTIIYEKQLFSLFKLKYRVTITDDSIRMDVGETYYKLIHYRIMNYHSVGYILTDLIEAILLNKGLATIYCASVELVKQKKCIALFSPPNTGKTLTSIRLCKDFGAKFISEDFAVTDGIKIYGARWTSSYRAYDKENKESRQRRTSLERYINTKVINSSILSDIFILENGKFEVLCEKDDMFSKLLSINRYGTNYHKAPLVVALGYYYPEYAPETLYRREKNVLFEIFKNCNFAIITSDNAFEYADIICEKVQLKENKID